MVARHFLARFDLPHPSVAAILAATGASKSRAYELVGRLAEVLPTLVLAPGRPPKAAQSAPLGATESLTRAVLEFLMAHPGSVYTSKSRRVYADAFRQRVIDLFDAQTEMDLGAFAKAVLVPVPTLEDWLRRRPVRSDEPASEETDELASLHIQSILDAYRRWRGNFVTFCKHVREHLRLDFGDSFISRILYTYGERTPRKRSGRTPDEEALRDAFETFFPGAQWVGDGKQVEVTINGVVFTFNFELFVDACSGAFVGASVRDEEDSQAVIDAFHDSVDTTQSPPIATLLDNRPSNHTTEVNTALGETIRIRGTEGRPQNKAHAEGAFGLFSQTAPPIVIDADSPRDLARQILELQLTTFGRTINHRPRRDRSWRSRFDLYNGASPTEEEIAEAKRALEQRRRRQEQARRNREARTDPLVRQILDEAFERLGLVDPEGHFRSTIALHGREAVVESIAIFGGKKNAGTLPNDADARYLLGIVKNLTHVHEANAITQALIRERLSARDRLLASLEAERQSILQSATTKDALLRALVERIVGGTREVDRVFWIDATAEQLRAQPPDVQVDDFRKAVRRIHATFQLKRHERQRIERLLARNLWPLT